MLYQVLKRKGLNIQQNVFRGDFVQVFTTLITTVIVNGPFGNFFRIMLQAIVRGCYLIRTDTLQGIRGSVIRIGKDGKPNEVIWRELFGVSIRVNTNQLTDLVVTEWDVVAEFCVVWIWGEGEGFLVLLCFCFGHKGFFWLSQSVPEFGGIAG